MKYFQQVLLLTIRISQNNIVVLLLLLCFGCNSRDDYSSVPEQQAGYKPVFIDSTTFVNQISAAASKTVNPQNTLLIEGAYLYALEVDFGVQVYNVADTSKAPIPLFYINAPKTKAIALAGDYLVLQNNLGLIYLKINRFPQVDIFRFEVKNNPKQPTAITNKDGIPIRGKHFLECPNNDTERWFLEWQPTNLTKPKCFTIQN